MTYMHKCSRYDDTGTKLLDHGHDNTTSLESAEREKDWSENTNRRRGENGKHKTNTQRNVVVSINGFTCLDLRQLRNTRKSCKATYSFDSVTIGINAMSDRCQLRAIYEFCVDTYSTPAWKWQLTPSAETSPAGSSPSAVCA